MSEGGSPPGVGDPPADDGNGGATVTLSELRVEYGPTTALAGVDLAVDSGEFFTLVGPSGCGKTTTLRCIAGFEEPTAGGVAIDGEPMAGVPPEARGVGVVFQNYALFPHMSVRENVAYGLRFADPPGGASVDERVADLLDLVDLAGFGDRDPGTLSGGQRQRVALARALAPGPRLLLLDEPMSALDARLRERLRLQVRAIQRELGITTVYVTHDQEEALAVSDRVAVVSEGRVEQVGPPRAVYRRPATRFVAEFLGDNNVLAGSVAADVTADAGETEGSGGRTAAVDVGGARLALPAGAVGDRDEVTFCVRPEALRVGAGANRLSATVEAAEFLGPTTRLHCAWNGRRLTVRTDREVGVGETVEVGFDPGDAHVVE